MEYLVKDFSTTVAVLDEEAIQAVKYPLPDEVEVDDWESTLALMPIRHFSLHDKLKKVFGAEVDRFRVVLHQKRSVPCEESHAFVLCTGVNRRTVEEALHQLHTTLKPLMKDGEVVLTAVLLQAAILPRPKSARQLSNDLVQVMEKQHEGHPQWVTVVQALLIDGCAAGDQDQVNMLVTKGGGDLESCNKKGNTPLQVARRHAPTFGLDWLLAHLKVDPDQTSDGLEAHNLHTMCQKDKHESIWDFIGSKIKEVGRHVLGETNALEQADKLGYSPLMNAVVDGFTKSCIPLLMGGMDPNYPHPQTSDTALHYAVEHCNTSMVKLLCIFRADPCQANAKGETPLDRAKVSNSKPAKDCVEILENIIELRKASTAYLKSTRSEPIPTGKSGSTYLLCLDGGGVRSFVMCMILLEIEARMKELEPECPPLGSFFDWIAGTSAGGIAALLLGHVNATLPITSAFIMRIMSDIFCKPKADRRTRMETLLKEYLGDNSKMADQTSTKLIITTTLANRSPSKLHLMCNYGEPRDGQKGPEDRLTWEAGLATSAAPLHFPSFENKFLDGGLMANNPTLDAMTEIFNDAESKCEPVNLGFVLSVGTGFPPSETVDDVELFLSHPFKMFDLDTISGLTNLLDLFVDQVMQSNGPPVERAKAWCKTISTPYIRLSPPLSSDFSPATTEMSEIVDMLFDGYKYVLRNPEEIDTTAKLLLAKNS